MRPLVVIPARMGANRLPGKPLADIHGVPMVVHVLRRALEAKVGPVVVACAEREVAAAVERAGGVAVMTDPALPSGSDRVHAALAAADPAGAHDVVVNLQGDLPTLDPAALRAVLAPLEEGGADIATLAAPLAPGERDDADVVKIALRPGADGRTGSALGFWRYPPEPAPAPLFHHVGIYAYRRTALARFVALPQTAAERRERLEQLRALEAGMRIAGARVDSCPRGVDTPADLERARRLLSPSADPSPTVSR